jgi:hypothetical protein
MPAYGECGIYNEKCRNKTCDHVTNPNRKVPTLDYVMDIKAANGVPFRVVYGVRNGLSGKPLTTYPVVAFYDRRSQHTAYGQFVSDYRVDDLMWHPYYGLNLDGGVGAWTVDINNMVVIMDWLGKLINPF